MFLFLRVGRTMSGKDETRVWGGDWNAEGCWGGQRVNGGGGRRGVRRDRARRMPYTRIVDGLLFCFLRSRAPLVCNSSPFVSPPREAFLFDPSEYTPAVVVSVHELVREHVLNVRAATQVIVTQHHPAARLESPHDRLRAVLHLEKASFDWTPSLLQRFQQEPHDRDSLRYVIQLALAQLGLHLSAAARRLVGVAEGRRAEAGEGLADTTTTGGEMATGDTHLSLFLLHLLGGYLYEQNHREWSGIISFFQIFFSSSAQQQKKIRALD